jgi:undecaprenyl-diphosphatase
VPIVVKIFILAIVQGFCELLPVSSSAHVIIAEKLMGLDPTAPAMTFLLVMLHTGTMLAVIGYFWSTWRSRYFSSAPAFWGFARSLCLATVCTAIVGFGLMLLIERVILRGAAKAEVETLFGNTTLIAVSLAAVGILIIVSGLRAAAANQRQSIAPGDAVWIGVVQGLCLPFRGFSRSGATISTGLFRGLHKEVLENYSFALAVILTPPVIAREGYRLLGSHQAAGMAGDALGLLWPSLVGMGLSFVAGWLSLKWLSRWLEHGRWHLFGYYCLFAAAAVFAVGKYFLGPVS